MTEVFSFCATMLREGIYSFDSGLYDVSHDLPDPKRAADQFQHARLRARIFAMSGGRILPG